MAIRSGVGGTVRVRLEAGRVLAVGWAVRIVGESDTAGVAGNKSGVLTAVVGWLQADRQAAHSSSLIQIAV